MGRRKDRDDVFSTSAARYWAAIDDLCRAIDQGDASIGLPPYNGGLFDRDRTPLLGRIRLGDEVMAKTIDALSFEQTPVGRRYINYRDLGVQQLGSIYERLLEHEIVRHDGEIAIRPNVFARKGCRRSIIAPPALSSTPKTSTDPRNPYRPPRRSTRTRIGCPILNTGFPLRSVAGPPSRIGSSGSRRLPHPQMSGHTTIFRMRSAGFPHIWVAGWVPPSPRCPGCGSPTSTRTHRAMLRLTILPLSFYNSRQDADLSDTILAVHLYAGADYSLNDKTLLGLKLTYSMTGNIEAISGYSLHPLHERDPDFPNHNTFTGARYWTLSFTVKFLFGN